MPLRGLLRVAVLLSAGVAFAWPSTIRHNYASCVTCHADPSGSGLLTDYGRAQFDLLLRFRPDRVAGAPEPDVNKSAGLLFGALTPPDWLLASANLRGGALLSVGNSVALRPLVMALDVRAQATLLERIVVNGSLGYSIRGGELAALTPTKDNNLVSREHWVGVKFLDGDLLLRAGRMNLPFGLRNPEHTSWVRTATRTDINTGQQHGVALSYSTDKLRGEVMAVLGNYQLRPDIYRQRGYSAFAEYALQDNLALGVSSLITWTQLDPIVRRTLLRQAHGAFVRWVPTPKLVVLSEADVLVLNPARLPGSEVKDSVGYVALVQGDLEPVQGLHAMLSLEVLDERRHTLGPSLGAWATFLFFFAPHTEFRIDAIYRHTVAATGASDGLTLLAQLHLFL